MEGFPTLWLQIMSVLQFIETVSIPDGPLRQENEKAVTSILRHANTFGLFRVVKEKEEKVKEEGKESETMEECSELWRHTVTQLSSFKEEMLKKILV